MKMLRAIQILATSSRFTASPWQKWKPLSRTSLASFITSNKRKPSFRSRGRTIHSTSNDNDGAASNPSPTLLQAQVSFCQWCGAATEQAIRDGDDKMRAICTMCGKVAYQNPKMVVGCVVEHDNKVLLCQRKIQPSYGRWCLPSGYLELGESAMAGAARETWEEAGAEVEVISPFAQLDIPYIGQTYMFFRARMTQPHFAPGPESLDCRLFAPEDIPFDSLAFSSMVVSLDFYIEDLKAARTKFHYCTINKRPDTGPTDLRAYTLDDHLQL